MPLIAEIAMLTNIVNGDRSSPRNLRATVISLIINKQIKEIGAHRKLDKDGAKEAHIKINIVIIDPKTLFENILTSKSSFGPATILIRAPIIANTTKRYANENGIIMALCSNNVHSSAIISYLLKSHIALCILVDLA
jgi:hypothetical protein